MSATARVAGYLLKKAEADVQRTIVAVARGDAVFGPRVAEQVVGFFAGSGD